jgi:hypothetical protein
MFKIMQKKSMIIFNVFFFSFQRCTRSIYSQFKEHILLEIDKECRIEGITSHEPKIFLDSFSLTWLKNMKNTYLYGKELKVYMQKNFIVPMPLSLKSMPPWIHLLQFKAKGPWGDVHIPHIELFGTFQKGVLNHGLSGNFKNFKLNIPQLMNFFWSSTGQCITMHSKIPFQATYIHAYAATSLTEKILLKTSKIIIYTYIPISSENKTPIMDKKNFVIAPLNIPGIGTISKIDLFSIFIHIPQKNITLTAEQLSYKDETQTIEFHGNVHIFQKTKTLFSELRVNKLSFCFKTKQLQMDCLEINTNILNFTQDLTSLLKIMTEPDKQESEKLVFPFEKNTVLKV